MCYSPILIKITPKYRPLGSQYALRGEIKGEVYKEVPCGKCLECKRRYQQDWANRCYEEWKSKGYKGVFFTLTYNNDSIPVNYLVTNYADNSVNIYRSNAGYNFSSNLIAECSKAKRVKKGFTISATVGESDKNIRGRHLAVKGSPDDCIPEEVRTALLDGSAEVEEFHSVRQKDVQLWLKRARKQLNKKFTYYITSEYGPTTLRPHYHGILFGVTAEECVGIFTDWKVRYGTVTFDNVTGEGGLNYCASYSAKGIFEHPLCKKDFFYPKEDGTFTEYHSKRYEKCIEKYGIDAPIVDKTFHAISKRFGAGYLTPEKLEYFKLKFHTQDDYVKLSEKLKYVNRNGFSCHLPEYYRTKILSQFVQYKMQAIVSQRDVEVSQEQYGFLEAQDPTREVLEDYIKQEIKKKDEEIKYRKKRCLEKYNSFIKKAKI